MSKILVVCSHPDDESFSMGGTIAMMVGSGHEVWVEALADGVGSRVGPPGMDQRRASHYWAATAVLGVSNASLAGAFPDQQSDTVRQLQINIRVAATVAHAKPDAVYTHWVGDLNLDHRRTAEAVLVATRPGTYRCQVFAMTPEYPSRCVGPKFEPNVTVDISDVLETKLKACQCYTDEMRWYPHPRSERAILEQTVERFHAYD